MYKNTKVNAILAYVASYQLTTQDFADLAVAAADQAGLSLSDQSLFEQLLTAAVEERKHALVTPRTDGGK